MEAHLVTTAAVIRGHGAIDCEPQRVAAPQPCEVTVLELWMHDRTRERAALLPHGPCELPAIHVSIQRLRKLWRGAAVDEVEILERKVDGVEINDLVDWLREAFHSAWAGLGREMIQAEVERVCDELGLTIDLESDSPTRWSLAPHREQIEAMTQHLASADARAERRPDEIVFDSGAPTDAIVRAFY